MELISKDEIAAKLYGEGRKYNELSAWGRKKVDHVNSSLYPPADTSTQETSELRKENLRLAGLLEQAKLENLELWDENTELKTDLEELRAEFNPPSS